MIGKNCINFDQLKLGQETPMVLKSNYIKLGHSQLNKTKRIDFDEMIATNFEKNKNIQFDYLSIIGINSKVPKQTNEAKSKNLERIFSGTNNFHRNGSLKRTPTIAQFDEENRVGNTMGNFKPKSSSTIKSRINIKSVLNLLSERFDHPEISKQV